MKDVVVNIRMDSETKAAIQAEATKQGRSLSNFIQWVLVAYLKEHQNATS